MKFRYLRLTFTRRGFRLASDKFKMYFFISEEIGHLLWIMKHNDFSRSWCKAHMDQIPVGQNQCCQLIPFFPWKFMKYWNFASFLILLHSELFCKMNCFLYSEISQVENTDQEKAAAYHFLRLNCFCMLLRWLLAIFCLFNGSVEELLETVTDHEIHIFSFSWSIIVGGP